MGMKFAGLLDSGASRCIMDESCWLTLRSRGAVLLPVLFRHIVVADGSKTAVLGQCKVEVKLEDRKCQLAVLVVPKLSQSIILGIDFWKELGIIPDVKQGTWRFSDDSVETAAVDSECHPRTLNDEQKVMLNRILDRCRRSTFDGLQATPLVRHHIDTGEAVPIKQRYYILSPVLTQELHRQVNELLEQEIIRPSKIPWSSPILLVKKKDNTFRVCVDFRKLNKVTKRDAYPLPFVNVILDMLRDAKYLSTIDLKSAYWQIELNEESKEKTAFVVPGRGLFEFTRIPFGLHNAPATWQRLIDRMLGHDLHPHVFVYLDDIIVVASTFDEHLRILEEVLKRLRAANLTINEEKSHFCKNSLKYLGYVVDSRGLHVDSEKVDSICQYPPPKTVRGLRRFIGMSSCYRRFVPSFASRIAPLTAMTKKNAKVVWSPEAVAAFEDIKGCLASAPILSCPDFSRPFTLQTDASAVGIAGVLTQDWEDGEHVIAYASRILTK